MVPLLCAALACILKNKKRPVVFFSEASTWLPSQITQGRTCFPSCTCSSSDWLECFIRLKCPEHPQGLEGRVCISLREQCPLKISIQVRVQCKVPTHWNVRTHKSNQEGGEKSRRKRRAQERVGAVGVQPGASPPAWPTQPRWLRDRHPLSLRGVLSASVIAWPAEGEPGAVQSATVCAGWWQQHQGPVCTPTCPQWVSSLGSLVCAQRALFLCRPYLFSALGPHPCPFH